MSLLLLLVEDDEPASGEDPTEAGGQDGKAPHTSEAERHRRAHVLLEEAIRRREQERTRGKSQGGMKVDKYFGSKLPPVCARLGCYVTDDGKRFYCVNPACQKHKKRETKHSRRGRPGKPRFVYFRCTKCGSRDVDMHVLANRYACRACKHEWER